MDKSNYVVLARKWRPAQFADIVGQNHIVRTLMNAMRSQRIHQAYLFTGSRGIGKTSIARIFAKVIRCEAVREVDHASGEKWLESCDQCPSCREIALGNSVDVIEIDGASNNGVEAVREIRENAKYLPSTGSRKIYIIDEVHMLTTAAFNALLKTLEEPPAHVIFIFATTEPHKIPATILSRCQRFDYRRVTMAQIQTRLAEVTKAEGVPAEAGGLALIARAAEGSMRDALSLLDQVIAFSGNQITVQSVRESVGLIEGQTLLGILSGVFRRKPLEALAFVDAAYQRGHDLRVLTRSLIEFLHGAILAKVGSTNANHLELSEEEWAELKSVAELRELEEIEMIFQVLHQGLDWIARSPQPKVVLDVLLVKCATAEALAFASALPPSGAEPAKPVTSAPRASSSTAVTPPTKPAATAQPTPAATVPAPALVSAPAPTPAVMAAPSSPAPQLQSATAPKTVSWEGFIEHVRKTRPLLASILEHGTCTGLPTSEASTDASWVICFSPKDAYFKEQLQSRAYAEQLLNLTKDYFGRPLKPNVELKDMGESLAARKDRELKEKTQEAKNAAMNHPIIMEARSLFGGELGPIELLNDSGAEGNHHANA